MARLGLIFVVAALGCSSGGSSAPKHVVVPPPPPPPAVVERLAPPPAPTLRLDGKARPTRYAVELVIQPESDSFAGTATIGLELADRHGGLWLHGVDLTIEHATIDAGGDKITATQIPPTDATREAEVIGFAFDRPVAAGAATLTIRYTGKVSSQELDGIHRQQERDQWYVFTQFEATDARRGFPSFDEPSYKVPFELTLHVKPELVAVANAPAVSEVVESNGMKTVKFAPTQPLPTYLIAFAVGPFDIVDGGKAGKRGIPVRTIVPKGRGADAAYTTQSTPALLALLEDYFGMPYPYDKLDQIAVPRKGGAMENAGLITYGQGILIWPPEEDSIARRRRFASVAAHELGHQWFGDLVTLAWWNDIWLNESFASWVESTIVARWQPSWQYEVGQVTSRSGVMRRDNLASTRKIRQPIESKHDIATAFDGITYGKGSAVLRMVEVWLGRERFQASVRAYLAAHQHGVAKTEDFLAALGPEAAQVLASFLDQPGVPLVGVELRCEAGRAPTLSLTQQRYTVAGSPAVADQIWHVPVCVKFGAAKPEGRACTVLAAAQGTLELPTSSCPTWVLANDGELGYYHVEYKGELLAKLLAAAKEPALTFPERVGVYSDLPALVEAGTLPLGTLLALAPALAKDPSRHVVSAATTYAGYLDYDSTPKPLRPNRARFVRKLFGERARKLGWLPIKGEPEDAPLLRSSLVGWVASVGEDPVLIASAKQLANRWLADRTSVPPEVAGTVLGIATRFGDRALFDKLHAAVKVEKDRRERGRLLGAISGFVDPEIVKAAMAIALTDELPAYESIGLVWGALDEDNRELAYQFIKTHYAELIAKLPREYSFARAAGAFCDPAHRADAEAFFKDKVASTRGGPRSFAQMFERVDQCIARKQRFAADIAKFLARY